jgi:ABC-type transport system substrate-binding protein
MTLIAPPPLEVQATVVGKMLEQVGFTVERQILAPAVYNRQTRLPDLDQPAEHQGWDIALTSWVDSVNFPPIQPYAVFALGSYFDWVLEEPELQRLSMQVLRTVDREHQQALIRQMEQHTRDQAYFLFLYNPIKLYAVNKAVDFVPYVSTTLNLAETTVIEQHWSVRKQGAGMRE